MNSTEAAALLAHCAAFDNRQPSIVAAQAWAAALHNIPFDQDTKDAVAAYYRTTPKDPNQRLWIMPHHIPTFRSKLRSQRLENFVYEGDPDETPRQYLARYRRQIEAAANGQLPVPTTRPILEGPPHPSVANVLKGTVKRLNDNGDPETPSTASEPAQRPHSGPLGIICPDCSAPIGRPCKSAWRHKPRQPHPARRRAAAGEPIRLTSQDEINARRHLATHHLNQEQP